MQLQWAKIALSLECRGAAVTLLPGAPPVPRERPDETLRDRRRPGRAETVSPELIPLLRRKYSADPNNELAEQAETLLEPSDPDQLRPILGIIAGLLISAPLWACLCWVVAAALFRANPP